MAGPVRIALVCPDGISILLFCKGIIRALQTIPGAEVIVVSDAGEYGPGIEALGAKSVSVPIARWVNPIEDWRYYRRLIEVFRRERCDVVLNFSTKANIYGSLAATQAGVPLILSHVVGLGGAFLPPRSLRDQLLRRVAMFLYRRAMRVSKKVWFTNGNDREFFIANGIVTSEQSILTRNYLDVSEYARSAVPDADVAAVRAELGLPPADLVVVMVARMIWPKGVREFAEAAEQLKSSHPNLHFLLVAPLETGSPDAVPESYVREKERTANFKWLGFRRDVKTIYALSDIGVLPSFYKEGGYPRALLEPMCMAKPVITTTSDDCRGTVEEGRNGHLVPIRDSSALAEAIADLAGDAGKREAFGAYSLIKARRDFDEGPIVHEALRAMGLPVRLPPTPR